MPALASDLRKQLENVCIAAREKAEEAAESALKKRGVDAAEPHAHFTDEEKTLRVRLRARGRQAGDNLRSNKTQSIEQLTQELAYEYWHRMLFARFLAENNLLMHPDGISVSLEDCEELAKSEGASNGYVLAARYASKMLPQIFRTDDVLLEIEFAPEHRLALEKLLTCLPRESFLADDSLGWVYQFWQSKRKDEVNRSGNKIDGHSLPAVTQLFTEHYMVMFLLHNTLGAWHAGKVLEQHPELIKSAPDEATLRQAVSLETPAGNAPWNYLRFVRDTLPVDKPDHPTGAWRPAAGAFAQWPRRAAELKVIDPCCGSGHFLVSGFKTLVKLRIHEESLSVEQAVDAVLAENLFGLEIDPRCTQLAAFNLALAAWKLTGFRPLPMMNIACSGQGVSGNKEEWLALANGDNRLREGMDRLYELFKQAPHLGSLIDPNREKGDMHDAGYAELQPLLKKALQKKQSDIELTSIGVAAQGITKAAELLAGKYTLVVTNVPYLGRGKQNDIIKNYLEEHYEISKADMATAFVHRALQLCQPGGSTSLVTPQNWLFLTSYKKLRDELLKRRKWNLVARLGPRAFETIGGEVVNVTLLILSAVKPADDSLISGLDVAEAKTPGEKSDRMANRVSTELQVVKQSAQLRNPDARIVIGPSSDLPLLSSISNAYVGLQNGDTPRFIYNFWEVIKLHPTWELFQLTITETKLRSGRDGILRWELGKGDLSESESARVQGIEAWNKKGIAVRIMGDLPVTLYDGNLYDQSSAVIVPNEPKDLPAIWCFCESEQFALAVREIDKKLNVTNATLVKVPFDLPHWQTVASNKYPHGLPQPHSDDPTQWLFKGDIPTSIEPLQVAVARLLDYRWPEQPSKTDAIDKLTDDDGIVCLPGIRGEATAVERFREMLQTAYAKQWSDSLLHQLLTIAGCKAGMTLDDWLRNSFFEQHCKLFNNRPFIWQIWDGLKDGFSCLVNYHKLTHKNLENLTYSYLGDWIKAQSAETKSGKVGADLRLSAAQELQEKLKLILTGEKPYDIFVRWKPLAEQAIGWHPDLNDGVRMNIRPFVEAGVLRKNPNIKWTKDRGKEPERGKDEYPWFWDGKTFTGERVNDMHLTISEKQAARKAKGSK